MRFAKLWKVGSVTAVLFASISNGPSFGQSLPDQTRAQPLTPVDRATAAFGEHDYLKAINLATGIAGDEKNSSKIYFILAASNCALERYGEADIYLTQTLALSGDTESRQTALYCKLRGTANGGHWQNGQRIQMMKMAAEFIRSGKPASDISSATEASDWVNKLVGELRDISGEWIDDGSLFRGPNRIHISQSRGSFSLDAVRGKDPEGISSLFGATVNSIGGGLSGAVYTGAVATKGGEVLWGWTQNGRVSLTLSEDTTMLTGSVTFDSGTFNSAKSLRDPIEIIHRDHPPGTFGVKLTRQ